MKVLVTGSAGFIGSTLVDRLLADGHEVVGVDNFSTGQRDFMAQASDQPKFRFYERDLLDENALVELLDSEFKHVFHLAANADVRFGLQAPRRDLDQNTIVTSNVLEAMRTRGVNGISFASTGSVYGEAPVIPTPETCPFPIQTSLYGASKLAAEGMISAYCEGYGFRANIFRFVSILGERYTHGHVFDFVLQLKNDSTRLNVLGNGKQRKSYLYIGDCIEALISRMTFPSGNKAEIYNLGTDEYVTVDDSIEIICKEMKVTPERSYVGGDRGWVGDNPFIFLDCAKIRKTGWKPRYSIRDSVKLTTRYLLDHPDLMKKVSKPHV